MNIAGTDFIMFLLQLACIGWPVFSLATLLALRHRQLEPVTQALWILIILLIPVLGASAFWIVQPSGND